MKTAIHPTVFETTVHCNSCDTKFTAPTTVKDITVEICSNCHPFYTGKQKLIDTAGRVDKFKARQAQAAKHAQKLAGAAEPATDDMASIEAELQADTVDAPAPAPKG